LPCQAVNKHNGKSDQNSQERLCNCTSSESHKKGYGHSNNISHGKSAATTPPKKKDQSSQGLFPKQDIGGAAGDCMWLDTLEEMCAKNYYQLFKNIHFLTTN